MTHLTVYKDQDLNATIIPNQFIDDYMVEANVAQIKIYLYLVRMTNANLPFSLSDIADRFNYMEKDVLRALRYWEKQKLLSLDYDSEQNLKAIHILPFPSLNATAEIVPITPKLTTVPAPVPKKAVYTASDLAAFQNNTETSEIIFIAEQYTGKMLSRHDMETLFFIYDTLQFSPDLIDYLIQYCVERGKKLFAYIKKVAIDWSESHITDVEGARLHTSNYNKQVIEVMRALGNSANPTEPEINYVKHWYDTFGFSSDIVMNACERAVLATPNNRFQYVDAILTNWHKANVKNIKDIEALDSSHQKSSQSSSKKKGGFNDFPQRSYDYDALEKMLISN